MTVSNNDWSLYTCTVSVSLSIISQMLLLFKLRSILQPDLTGPPENNKLPKKKLFILYGKNITNAILKPESVAGDQAKKQRVSSNPSVGKI